MKFSNFILLMLSCQICKFQNINEINMKPIIYKEESLRIIGGQIAELKTSKHVVSLRLANLDMVFFGAGHICGGTVIRNNLVLTAAHCLIDYTKDTHPFRGAHEFIVVMGTLNRFIHTSNTLNFSIQYKYHNQFNLSSLENDIALINLNGVIPIDHPTVVPIKLTELTPIAKTLCMIHGWGAIKFGSQAVTELRYADIEIIDLKICSLNYQDSLKNGMLCAGDMKGEKDTCQGDSGGPLICNQELVGIVSWGEKCATVGYPGIYTEITTYKNWIINELLINNTANIEQTKYLASIRLKLKDNQEFGSGHICGGVFINTTTTTMPSSVETSNFIQILTAAHCLFDRSSYLPLLPADLTVVLGTLDRYEKTIFTLQFDVLEIKIHSNYTKKLPNGLFSNNNLAILVLNGTIPDNHPTIESINLPSDQTTIPNDHDSCKIDGWGESYPTRKAVNKIQTRNITIIDKNICNEIYKPELLDGMLCAGELNQLQDIVNTDDGGPLSCNGQLIGILSERIDFGFQGFPSIYNDIQYHSKWILTDSGINRTTSIHILMSLILSMFLIIKFLI